jgi:hypothetical protein
MGHTYISLTSKIIFEVISISTKYIINKSCFYAALNAQSDHGVAMATEGIIYIYLSSYAV